MALLDKPHVPPTIPSKWDIIPIHTSDVASFLRCRRYWDWTSPTRNNLRRRVEIHGINFPLWFGTGIHYALEMYYNPVLSRDPVEAFQTWFTVQWEGGVVTSDWLERSYDLHPKRVEKADDVSLLGGALDVTTEDSLWYVRGLRDLHPDPSHEEFMQHRELGINMMKFYKEYAEKNDDFQVISAEAKFSIPLGFEAIDVREESPNYGKKIEVHARGMRDAIIQFYVNEKFGIIDHKTASKIDEAYLIKLEMDRQCGNYMWASQEEARLYDFPWTKIDYVIYQALWKKYPVPPTFTSRGVPSIDRQNESCTAEMFAEAVAQAGLTEWVKDNEKAAAYYQWLVESGNDRFLHRAIVYRNQHEIKNIGLQLREVAEEMLNPDLRIYPHPTGDFLCTRCALRAPCLAKDDGSDWQDMLRNGYETNRDR